MAKLMFEKAFQISELIQKDLQGNLPAEERLQLEEWVAQSEENKKLYEELRNEDFVKGEISKFNAYDAELNRQKILGIHKGRVVQMKLSRWIAAASIILVLGFASYFVFFNGAGKPAVDKTEMAKNNDVPAPSGTRAMITLADGSTIYLDSVGGGTLAVQNEVQVMKTAEGKVVYTGATTKGELVYNTLFNPRGSKVVDMQLSDGSHVWLNAGSSLTYPVAFVGNERKVTIKGEAYFEVAHDDSKPFVVSKDDVSVTVLGTHFNVNAYDDEDALKVTLLEGSVRVASNGNLKVIKPGEQAIAASGKLQVASDVDLNEVMAWKNGIFKFKDATIESVMRQIARWYDVEVSYEGKVTNHFIATIPRNVSAANAFKILEQTGGVNFKIEGNKVMVTP